MPIGKILVVEDDEGVRELLQNLFDDEGCAIVVAGNGTEVRAALAAEAFGVALIDITLPGDEDGFALACLARDTGCSVILVTGDADHIDAVEASGHRFLLKPYRIERLLGVIAAAAEEAAGAAVPAAG